MLISSKIASLYDSFRKMLLIFLFLTRHILYNDHNICVLYAYVLFWAREWYLTALSNVNTESKVHGKHVEEA